MTVEEFLARMAIAGLLMAFAASAIAAGITAAFLVMMWADPE